MGGSVQPGHLCVSRLCVSPVCVCGWQACVWALAGRSHSGTQCASQGPGRGASHTSLGWLLLCPGPVLCVVHVCVCVCALSLSCAAAAAVMCCQLAVGGPLHFLLPCCTAACHVVLKQAHASLVCHLGSRSGPQEQAGLLDTPAPALALLPLSFCLTLLLVACQGCQAVGSGVQSCVHRPHMSAAAACGSHSLPPFSTTRHTAVVVSGCQAGTLWPASFLGPLFRGLLCQAGEAKQGRETQACRSPVCMCVGRWRMWALVF